MTLFCHYWTIIGHQSIIYSPDYYKNTTHKEEMFGLKAIYKSMICKLFKAIYRIIYYYICPIFICIYKNNNYICGV